MKNQSLYDSVKKSALIFAAVMTVIAVIMALQATSAVKKANAVADNPPQNNSSDVTAYAKQAAAAFTKLNENSDKQTLSAAFAAREFDAKARYTEDDLYALTEKLGLISVKYFANDGALSASYGQEIDNADNIFKAWSGAELLLNDANASAVSSVKIGNGGVAYKTAIVPRLGEEGEPIGVIQVFTQIKEFDAMVIELLESNPKIEGAYLFKDDGVVIAAASGTSQPALTQRGEIYDDPVIADIYNDNATTAESSDGLTYSLVTNNGKAAYVLMLDIKDAEAPADVKKVSSGVVIFLLFAAVVCAVVFCARLNKLLKKKPNKDAEQAAAFANAQSAANDISSVSAELAKTKKKIAETEALHSGGIADALNLTTEFNEECDKVADDITKAVSGLKALIAKTEQGENLYFRLHRNIEESMQSGKAISDDIAKISDGANKIKRLAFNAAMEAARAGEAGKGFALIADDFSAVANESGAIASGITEIIEGLERSLRALAEDTSASESAFRALKDDAKSAEKNISQGFRAFEDLDGQLDRITANLHAMNNSLKKYGDIAETQDEISESLDEKIKDLKARIDDLKKIDD